MKKSYKQMTEQIEADTLKIIEIGKEIQKILDFTSPYKTEKERIQEFANQFKTGFTPDHYFKP